MRYEGYRITLIHYAVDLSTGKVVPLDDPVVVEQAFDRSYGGSPIILNRMLEELKEYVLNRVRKE